MSYWNNPRSGMLKQRITFSYRLLPLNKVALTSYVKHRLSVAGYSGRDLFTNQAYDYLHHVSQGIPRLINIICHKSLLAAYGRGDSRIRINHIRSAVRDTNEAQQVNGLRALLWLPRPAYMFAAGLGLVTLVVLLGMSRQMFGFML